MSSNAWLTMRFVPAWQVLVAIHERHCGGAVSLPRLTFVIVL